MISVNGSGTFESDCNGKQYLYSKYVTNMT